MFIQDLFVALVHAISLLALMAIAFGVVERQAWHRAVRSVLQGAIFGGGAIVAMMNPTRIGEGVFVDSRALIVGFAAAFGGWPAALVALAIAGTYRMWLGGVGAVPGALGIAAAAMLGLGWRYLLRPQGQVKVRHLIGLGLVISCYVLTGLVMGYTSLWSLVHVILPFMVTASVMASVLLGLFVERELGQIEREQQWKTHALTDPLTGLPNRRAFERGMEAMRGSAAETALLIIDLDHFKVVNDTHGHAAGDHVLQQVSRVLRDHTRQYDLLSRLGGEELAVLLPDTDATRAWQVAERLRQAIAGLDMQWQGRALSITASIGVAIASGSTPGSALFVQADAALYAAKRSGRNCVVFSGEMLMRPPVVAPASGPVARPERAA
jgi:diguanylate cyclase